MRNSAIGALLVILGILVGLCIAEGILSWLNLPKFYRAHSSPPQFLFRFADEGQLIYTNTPSDTIEFVYDGNPREYFDENAAVQHTTNSWGFRGGSYSTEKDSGTFRIAFIGDSFTFGEGVKDADVYSELVKQKLQSAFPDMTIEVYNFGVGGYNTSQSIFLLENLALGCRPDAVVLGYTLNDAEPQLFYYDSSSHSAERRPRETRINEGLGQSTPPADNMIFRLRIARLGWQIWNARKTSAQTIHYYRSLYREGRADWRNTAQSLQRYERICGEVGVRCYLVLFPVLFQLDDDYPFSDIHEKVVSHVGSGVSTIDLYPVLHGCHYRDLWVHPTDQHPNEKVHRLVADTLAKAIEFDLRRSDI